MEKQAEKTRPRPRELNLFFLAIAVLIYAFSFGVFPAFFEMATSIGTMLPEPFLFFCHVFETIGQNGFPYFIGCSTYYALSLRFIKPAANKIINLALLVIFALILLLFAGPFDWSLGTSTGIHP